MRLVFFALVLGSAVAYPQNPPAPAAVVDTYRTRVSWYESETIPVCEVLPPLSEDFMEVLVRVDNPFLATIRTGNSQRSVSGVVTRARNGRLLILNFVCEQELTVDALPAPIVAKSSSSQSVIPLVPNEERFLSGSVTVGDDGATTTPIVRRRERLTMVSLTPET